MSLKFFNFFSISIAICSFSVFVLSSCSNEQSSNETKRIDGTDWSGWEYGKFSSNDYTINHQDKSVTYTNGVQIYATDLVIPNYVFVNGQQYKVLLGEYCFKKNHYLTGTITFNIHTTFIPKECFYNCDQIENIIFKNYITSFENKCFYDCTSLFSIASNPIYMSRVVKYDDYCFFGTSLDINFTFGSELEYIGAHAFSLVIGLAELDLSHNNKLIDISDYAFFGCSGLYKVIFPGNLKKIGNHAFEQCVNLTEITLPQSDMQFSIGDWTFHEDKSLVGFSRECSFTKIGDNAFDGCNKFVLTKKMLINDELKDIGSYAFSGCYNSSIYIPKNVGIIRRSAFAFNNGVSGNLQIIDFSDYDNTYPILCGSDVFYNASGWGTIIINKYSNYDTWLNLLSNRGIEIGSGGWTFQIV